MYGGVHITLSNGGHYEILGGGEGSSSRREISREISGNLAQDFYL